MSTLSYIVAIDEKNAMGRGNQLPWHLPDDFKYFKKTTLGKPILMGRKTFESLGKPLPGRLNIVLSHQQDLGLPEEVLIYADLQAAIKRMDEEGTEETFIIGGGQLFAMAMPLVERLYITRVHTIVPDADTFFPEIDHSHWHRVWAEQHETDEKHKFAFTFELYERVNL